MGRKKKFNDQPFPYRTEIELEITTLTNLGVGLGRVKIASSEQPATDQQPQPPAAETAASGPEIQNPKSKIQNGTGWVVMVPFTLPGERVRARVYRNHKNFSEADLLEVLMPSPHRIAAPCPLFGRCGGCQYQHLTYVEQLAWKRRQVEELLQHMAGVTFPVSPTVGSPREYGYRSKITPHFAAPRRHEGSGMLNAEGGTPEQPEATEPSAPALQPQPPASTGGGAAAAPIGFLKQGSRFDLIDVPACPIATSEINAKLTEVRAETRRKLAAGDYQRGATLLLRHAQEGVVTDYDAIIHELIAPGPESRASSLPPQPPAAFPAGGAELAADTHPPQAPAAPSERRSELARDIHTPAAFSESGSELARDTRAASPNARGERHPSDHQAASAAHARARPLREPAETCHIIDDKTAGARPPLRLHFLARDFFQNNPFILPAFTGYVREQAAGTGARFLVDAYCGSGLFALSCAPAFERVAGVEVSATSVQFARENAAANSIGNATFSAGDAATIFAGLDATFTPAETVVVIDPPRKGCDESFLQQLFTFGPRAVVYVSCDPATQMRDLKHFLAAGYELTAVQPFDLFPQTRHLECVITLRRG